MTATDDSFKDIVELSGNDAVVDHHHSAAEHQPVSNVTEEEPVHVQESDAVDNNNDVVEEKEGDEEHNNDNDNEPVDDDDEEDDDDDEEEEEEDEDEELQKPYGPVILPMPDLSEFTVTLPGGEDGLGEQEPVQPLIPEPAPLAPLPDILHVPVLLKPYETGDSSPSLQGLQVCHLGRETGLRGEMQAMYLHLPPGTRLSRPVAYRLGDVIAYCISGSGLVWHNGWTFPFNTTDAVGWKAGTGIPHTIINDSNADGSAGKDLVILFAHEDKPQESHYYPFSPDREFAVSVGTAIWSDTPTHADPGPHPGVPTMSSGELGNASIPSVQVGYRPSNLINTIAELDAIGEGELFANATSLSQETGLSGRFGCNFEVPPPGARSSEPHAHSLEDELVYIVSGTGVVWLNGNVTPVTEGDVVGFPAGTGIAHTFINDSNANGQEGEPLMLWILGQNRVREGDLVHYPLKVKEAANVNSKRWWPNPPKYELGPHNGHAQRPLRF